MFGRAHACRELVLVCSGESRSTPVPVRTAVMCKMSGAHASKPAIVRTDGCAQLHCCRRAARRRTCHLAAAHCRRTCGRRDCFLCSAAFNCARYRCRENASSRCALAYRAFFCAPELFTKSACPLHEAAPSETSTSRSVSEGCFGGQLCSALPALRHLSVLRESDVESKLLNVEQRKI